MWKILVVDDNERNVELIVETLEGIAKCQTAKNGEEALTAYNTAITGQNAFDVALLDVAMPGIDGIDVLKAIRAKEEERGIPFGEGMPIIMVTANKEPFIKAYRTGCDDYILKPIDPEKLITMIEEKLSNK